MGYPIASPVLAVAVLALAGCAGGPLADDSSANVLFGSLAARMDANDKERATSSLFQMRNAQWTSATGGRFTMRIDHVSSTGFTSCRDYTLEGVVEGQRQIVVGTACREQDGTWRPTR